MTDYDIIIAGGGLVGANLACALAGSGLRLAIVEPKHWQDSQRSYDDRSLALGYGSRRIFEGIGLWQEISVDAMPIKRIHISDCGRFGFARLDASDAGIDALGYVLEVPALGKVLYRALQKSDAIDLFCPAAVTGLALEHDAARVDLQQAGAHKAITARLIVGADGGRSRVREIVGIGAHTTDYGQNAVVANVTPGRRHNHIAYERFTESGPLALLPMRDNRFTVVWSARREHVDTILRWDDYKFLQELQRRFGDRLGEFKNVGRRTSYPLSLTRVNVHIRARITLIGNAAHVVHPVAGQGFNLGLRDVAVLSEVIADAARAGRDIGDLAVLAQYSKLRRTDTYAVTLFTDGLIRIFANALTPLAIARNIGLIVTDLLPPVKRALIRRTSGLAGSQPRLARGPPL
ncbi:MAG: 2-octaprenyl-6-methoxyphenyl hydroxylase [Acidiferrobacterales bacterium]